MLLWEAVVTALILKLWPENFPGMPAACKVVWKRIAILESEEVRYLVYEDEGSLSMPKQGREVLSHGQGKWNSHTEKHQSYQT